MQISLALQDAHLWNSLKTLKICMFVPHLALGPAPLLSIEGYQDRGIRVVCRSSGWYPKPEVLWRELNGRLLSSLAKKDSQRNDGTFDVQAEIILKGSSNLTCVIRNSLLDLEKESTILITSSKTLFMAVLYFRN